MFIWKSVYLPIRSLSTRMQLNAVASMWWPISKGLALWNEFNHLIGVYFIFVFWLIFSLKLLESTLVLVALASSIPTPPSYDATIPKPKHSVGMNSGSNLHDINLSNQIWKPSESLLKNGSGNEIAQRALLFFFWMTVLKVHFQFWVSFVTLLFENCVIPQFAIATKLPWRLTQWNLTLSTCPPPPNIVVKYVPL